VTVDLVTPFDVCGLLPEGTTVLEASAGTGKTFTIAALATRYVAEGAADLSEVMLVTFSRAATQELRERVRERLVTAERGLVDPARARAHDGDALLRLLAGVPDDEVQRRRRRLTRALASFDAATIATTHGFCQQMLAGLGMAGDLEPATTFVDRIDDLVAEVVDDLYLRKFARSPTPPMIDYGVARKIARDAMADPHAELVPTDAADGSAAQQRYGLAVAVRREVESRKRARQLLDYDDLLTRLRDALLDPVRGPAARERIRSRYRVVLVDEFQDTDPVQWKILHTTFHATTTLVLIGDPKQAIYAFRGADLRTYLTASGAATSRCTLARNWRSDADLLTALAAVFRGAALGDVEIVVRPVDAEHAGRRLAGAGAPLRLRVASRAVAGDPRGGMPRVSTARPLVAQDVASDIVTLLSGPAVLTVDGERPVRAGDVAVLVRTNDQAVLVRDELARANVPAVLTGSRSVFLTRTARDWLTLLRAVEQPHRAGLVRAAALTCFLGWTAERLATAGGGGLDELGLQLRGWRDVLVNRGVAALLEVITATGQLGERLLASRTGERDLTDVRHIGEALHAAATGGQLGPAALVEWLQRRVNEAGEDSAEERSRRLESDADAVQVVTIHSSKGLEFPIVYVPFGWDRFAGTTPDPLRLHADDGTRLLDVGGPDGPSYQLHRGSHEAEEFGEDLRLLYVAMTRAMCQVVAWWVPSTNTVAAPLHRLLFGAFEPGEQPPVRVDVPMDRDARRWLETTAAASSGTIVVEAVADDRSTVWKPPLAAPAALTAAVFDRRLDGAWRRTSYSGLTAALHDPSHAPGVRSEPEADLRQDEPTLPPAAGPTSADGEEQRLRAIPSPLADLPAGTAFGTLVHRVLETVDTTAADLAGELRARCDAAVAGRLGSSVDAGALAQALLPVMDTPLGPLAGDHRLRDVAPVDRLAELEFELPLAGGDEPRVTDATLAALADLLRERLSPSDPLARYPDALDKPALRDQRLRGYLTGSIDAVLRLPDPSGQPRYVVVDYKTNWLGGFGPSGAEPLTAWHYRPRALAVEMVRAHYPLQALLYSAALHRFLRWRQPGYDPARHLGGVLYLFVRGMCGPSTPTFDGTPCGVFSWLPPAELVVGVSSLLDQGAV
jgi:exodeoxyribonuclease V beta subunit